ncbi:unnamed protein product [Lymnaea stagnalis]|uniref:SH3 domain-containing protein n=1 Tax=Lymnaea stagnalis TaxID=6523 RepID=A0AAV2I022_LYMST
MPSLTSHVMTLLLGVGCLIVLASATLRGQTVTTNTCVCVTEDAPLYNRAGYQNSVKRYLVRGICGLATGENLSIYGETWFRISTNGELMWSAGRYFTKAPEGRTPDACKLP